MKYLLSSKNRSGDLIFRLAGSRQGRTDNANHVHQSVVLILRPVVVVRLGTPNLDGLAFPVDARHVAETLGRMAGDVAGVLEAVEGKVQVPEEMEGGTLRIRLGLEPKARRGFYPAGEDLVL